jgi:hypothetical protein
MIITDELRAKLLLHLPDNYQKQCHEATGYSRAMVNKVMNEGHENDTIYDWLEKTALRNKRIKAAAERRRKQTARQL